MARSISTPLCWATTDLTQLSDQSALAVPQASQTIMEEAAFLHKISASLNEMTSQTKKSLAAARKIETPVDQVYRAVEDDNRRMEGMSGAIRRFSSENVWLKSTLYFLSARAVRLRGAAMHRFQQPFSRSQVDRRDNH